MKMTAAGILSYVQAMSESSGLIAVKAVSTLLPEAASCIDAPKPVPLERWDTDFGTSNARFGGFVCGAEQFDAAAFGVSRHPPQMHFYVHPFN